MVVKRSVDVWSEKRSWIAEKASVRWVFGGDVFVTHGPMQLTTILGSCIAACISDPLAGVAGMNHFMLPERYVVNDRNGERGALYGQEAMDQLLVELYAAGAKPDRLSIKLFGGAWPNHKCRGFPAGPANVRFVKEYLTAADLPIHVSDLGGEYSRRIHFMAGEDRVVCRRLDKADELYTPAAGMRNQNAARSGFDGAVTL